MYWLDYDLLCHDPVGQTQALCRFLECDPAAMAPTLDEVQHHPRSRHAGQCLAEFDPDDLDFVSSLGYAVHDPAAPGESPGPAGHGASAP